MNEFCPECGFNCSNGDACRLHAAAPDLLAGLKKLLPIAESADENYSVLAGYKPDDFTEFYEIIAKAEGKAS